MKAKWIIMFLAVSSIISGCNGQQSKTESRTISDTTIVKNTLPKENVKVNRQYDKDGNLIRYDSVYTYYYSNINNNGPAEDSILANFKQMFEETYPFSSEPYFDNLFFEDSLMQYDFYKKNFFYDRFMNNMKLMDQLFWDMDSVKNKFFMEQFPPNDDKMKK
jgi:hypothetical protein